MSKKCCRCKIIKPLSDFSNKKSEKSGINYYCRLCANKYKHDKYHSDIVKNRLHVKTYAKLRIKRLRSEVLKAYGHACACCGENREPFLTIEHVKKDGNVERRSLKPGPPLYVSLKRRGWPKDRYTLLCMNCNWATRRGEKCPHQK